MNDWVLRRVQNHKEPFASLELNILQARVELLGNPAQADTHLAAALVIVQSMAEKDEEEE